MAQDRSLVSLRWRWGITAAFFALVAWLGYQLLRAEWQSILAWRWAIVAAGVLAYELALLWRGLKDNHRRDERTLLPSLGAGNMLTMLRGLALGSLAGFLLVPQPSGRLAWLPAGLYTLAILADYLDGYLARVTHHATLLGETLDIEFDALGILVATWLAVNYGQLPGWYLLLGLSRYLFLFGIWWRTRRGKPVYDLPPSANRRMVAGFQMVFSSVMLWPIMHPPGTTLAGVVFALPFTASFGRDWLVVSGRLDPTSSSYLKTRHMLAVVMTGWLPLILRVGVLVVMVWLISSAFWSAPNLTALFAWPDLPSSGILATAIGLIAPLATLMLALGLAGRLAALGLVMAASIDILANGLYLYNGFLLTSTIALMLLGSGALSFWRPEDALLSRRAGQKEGDV